MNISGLRPFFVVEDVENFCRVNISHIEKILADKKDIIDEAFMRGKQSALKEIIGTYFGELK